MAGLSALKRDIKVPHDIQHFRGNYGNYELWYSRYYGQAEGFKAWGWDRFRLSCYGLGFTYSLRVSDFLHLSS